MMSIEVSEKAKIINTAKNLGVLPEALIVLSILEFGIYFYPKKDDSKFLIERELLKKIMSRLEGQNQNVEPLWVLKSGKYWLVDTSHETFPNPHKGRWLAEIARHYWSSGSGSDFAAIVYAYRAFKTVQCQLYSSHSFLMNWCTRWFLRPDKLEVADEAITQMAQDFAISESIFTHRVFNAENLTRSLLSGLPDNIGKIEMRDSKTLYRTYQGPAGKFKISNMSVCSRVEPWVITSTPKRFEGGNSQKKGDNLVAEFAAQLDPKWLLEFFRESFQLVDLSQYRYASEKDMVVGKKSFCYKNLEIGQHEAKVQDQAIATDVFCGWVAGQITGAEIELGNSMSPIFDEVIRCNRKRFLCMKSEVELMSHELKRQLSAVLGGAVSIATIPDLEALKLFTVDRKSILEKIQGNRIQWRNWRNRPELPCPDFTAGNPVLPKIVTVQYGTCCITSRPFLAYGSLNEKFETRWFKTFSEAKSTFFKAKVRLDETIQNRTHLTEKTQEK